MAREFPAQAPKVLHGNEAFAVSGAGFGVPFEGDPAEATGRRSGISVALPKRADEPIVFHKLGGFEFRAHEIGASGEGSLTEGAVAYPRRDGTSFWSTTQEGYEEWLHLRAGVATGKAPVAEWEIDGAQLREVNGAVEVADEAGAVQLRVTAPEAFARGGRHVDARLAVQGKRIELWVDAGGEAVLVDPIWEQAGSMTGSRYLHASVTLQDGTILVCGGNGSSAAVATAELYDPATNAWTPTGSMNVARIYHTATLLSNGSVLVAGGSNSTWINSAELYNPTLKTWAPTTAPMLTARNAHTATLLPDGTVLVAGGGNSSGALTAAETYSTSTGTWTAAGSMTGARYFHTATLLTNNKVFLAGGVGTAAIASTAIYDTVAKTWSVGLPLPQGARYNHTATLVAGNKVLLAGGRNAAALATTEIYNGTATTYGTVPALTTARYSHAATLLSSGQVLVTGGFGASALASAELFDPATSTWAAAGTMNTARYQHTSTLITASGKVLLVGGYNASTPFASAELYDPSANTWVSRASMGTARQEHTATLLQNGKVLVIGGINISTFQNSVELYDPLLNSWASLAPMLEARVEHTATLLQNGGVLVAGGTNFSVLASAAVYNPGPNTWTAMPSMPVARWLHTATLLSTGDVLIAGGTGVSGTGSLASWVLFKAASSTWGAPGLMSVARSGHTATVLASGKVLIAGGSASVLQSSDVFDPAAGTLVAGPNMNVARSYHTATLMGNGKVLFAGGSGASPIQTAEIYDPAMAGSFSTAASMSVGRSHHSATLLPNGRVLVAGGGGTSTSLASAEMYDPTLTVPAWIAAPSLIAGRTSHQATLLGNGRVFVTGGSASGGSLASTELYTPVTVDDKNPCTTDAWNAAAGQVTHTNVANGTACSDGNACTQSDTCQAGVCVGASPIVCGALDQCHIAGTCNTGTGVCSNPSKTNGTTCTDNNACTLSDTCQSGVCVSGSAVVIDDSNACTIDSCDSVTGVHHVANTGASCSDGNPCNGVEICNGSGACSPGATAPVGTVCADANACNGIETCDGLGVCKPGIAMAVGATCGGSTACSALSTCSAGHVCVAGSPVVNGTSCNQGTACTAGATCQSGQCVATANNGASCSDGDACNGLETCQNGVCQPGTPIATDASQCTVDTCNSVTGVVTHTTCATIDATTPTDIAVANAAILATTTVDVNRAAILRGIVMKSGGQALPNVKISIVNAPESGTTLSQLDGHFDIAVNGGGQVRVRYEKAGYLTVERSVEAVWKEYAWLPDVVMTSLDARTTSVTLDDTSMNLARGSEVQDVDGLRRATVLVPSHTGAVKIKNGVSTALSGALTIRATEFTVGPGGPSAMPAPLQPSTAYTYCVELTVDEALDADSIQFVQAQNTAVPQSLPFYVENFINFPVGATVPMGYYDRKLGEWVPSTNGRVVQVLSGGGGTTAVLATKLDGSGNPVHDAADETALGVTPDELVKIASLYVNGQTLWRVPITHFTPWDSNWPYAPGPAPCSAGDPNCQPDDPGGGDPTPDDPCKAPGSVIECQSQILGEAIPVAGSPYSLHYSSGRVPGRREAYNYSIPLVKAPPASLRRIDLTVQVAGQRIQQSFTCPCGNLPPYQFTWNGKDGYGRDVDGAQPISVDVGYVYNAVYLPGAAFSQAFGGGPAGTSSFTYAANRVDNQISTIKHWRGLVGPWDQRGEGLGGWSLDVHHVYDPAGRVLYLGNGDRRSTSGIRPALTTAVGNGFTGPLTCPTPTPGVCSAATVVGGSPSGLVTKPDGTLIFADTVGTDGIRQVSPSGAVTQLSSAAGANLLALLPDGTLLFTSNSTGSLFKVFKLDTQGNVTVLAGTGTACPLDASTCGDNGPATAASLANISALALGPDGSVYIGTGYRVRRVSQDGLIHAFAGTGVCSGDTVDDGQPATQVGIGGSPRGLLVAPDGNIYISTLMCSSTSGFIRSVNPSGKIGTIGGSITATFTGDGADAHSSSLVHLGALAMSPERYIVFAEQSRVRQIGANNIVTTLAGNPPASCTNSFCGEGFPATGSNLQQVQGLAFAPDGSLLISSSLGRVLRVAQPLQRYGVGTFVIPSADAGEVYVFDTNGRHLETHDGLTNALKYQFSYESGQGGRLTSIVSPQGTNHITTIAYPDATHRTITAPFGDVTSLVLDGSRNLTTLSRLGGTTANPVTETYTLLSTTDGLLTSFSDPVGTAMGYVHTLAYDVSGVQATGRLLSDSAPASGVAYPVGANQSLALSVSIDPMTGLNDYLVTRTTKQDVGTYSTTYDTKTNKAGVQTRTTTLPGATNKAVTAIGTDGSTTVTYPDGTVVNEAVVADPRYGLLAPTISQTTTLPVGPLTRTSVVNRALNSVTQVLDQTSAVNGNIAHRSYDPSQHTVITTTPGGRTTKVQLDSQGRVIGMVLPGLGAVSIGYTSDFGAISGATRSATSEISRVRTPATYPVGSAIGFTGRLHTITDANGDVTSFDSYDRSGRLLLETLPGNRAVGFAYDRNGSIVELDPPAITPSYGAGTTLHAQHFFTFSSVNQLGSYAVRDAAIPGTVLEPTSYTYTPDKLLKSIHRPEGDVVAVANSNGRADSTTLPTSELVQSTFDPATGNLQSLSGPTSGESVGFLYNGSMVTDMTWSGVVAGSVHRDYDNYFRTIGETAASSPAYFGYDADSLVNCINTTQAANCQGGEVVAYKTGTVLLDGTTFPLSSATPIVDSYSNNGFGEPTSYLAQRGPQVLYETAMSRDSLGRIASKTEQILNADGSVATHDYVYTYVNRRLTDVLVDGAITSHYDYDANGNRLRHTVSNQGVLSSQDLGTYNVQDRLGSYGTRSFAYTPSGRLLSATDGGDVATYTYDALGNLGQVVLTGSQSKTIVYILDGRGRRVGKKINGHLVQAWLYQDDVRIAAEVDYDLLGNLTSTKRFVYGSKQNVPDLMIQGTTRYRIVSDERGSPRMVISELGQIVGRTDYDEFGQVLATSTNVGLQPFGFAGGLYDADTKLVRFGARDYDPASGRWTAKDPIRFRGGSTNLYGYVFSDPINYRDPTGLYEVSVCELVVGAALAAAAVPGCGAAGAGSLGIGAYPCAAGSFTAGVAVVAVVCHMQEVVDATPWDWLHPNPDDGAGGAGPDPAGAGAGAGAGGGGGGGGGGGAGGGSGSPSCGGAPGTGGASGHGGAP